MFFINIFLLYFSSVLPRANEFQLDRVIFISAILIIVVLSYGFSKFAAHPINHKALSLFIFKSGKGASFQVSATVRNLMISVQVTVATLLIFANLVLFQQAIKPIIKDKGYELENIHELS